MIFGASSLAGVSTATSRLSHAVLDRGGCLDLSSFTVVEGAIGPKMITRPARPKSKLLSINSVSMLRTVELILGMPPMTQFDANAQPMFTCFTETPDLTPYDRRLNRYPLDEKNPADAIGAAECASWNWSMPDNVPSQRSNELIWKSIKGVNSEMPAPRHSISMNYKDDDD